MLGLAKEIFFESEIHLFNEGERKGAI